MVFASHANGASFLAFFCVATEKVKKSKSPGRPKRLGTLNHPHSVEWNNSKITVVVVLSLI